MKLAGRVAIVTGAAGGIGAAIVRAVAAEGARVVVADVQPGEATVAAVRAAGGEAVFIDCDVSDPVQVAAMVAGAVDHFGMVDMVVNNAGISGGSGLAHELDVEV